MDAHGHLPMRHIFVLQDSTPRRQFKTVLTRLFLFLFFVVRNAKDTVVWIGSPIQPGLLAHLLRINGLSSIPISSSTLSLSLPMQFILQPQPGKRFQRLTLKINTKFPGNLAPVAGPSYLQIHRLYRSEHSHVSEQ